MELMQETISEEVITAESTEIVSDQQDEMTITGDMNQQQDTRLNVEDAVFNPETGTFQSVSHMNSMNNSQQSTPQLQKIAPKKSNKAQPRKVSNTRI